jgi:hypothetical protein
MKTSTVLAAVALAALPAFALAQGTHGGHSGHGASAAAPAATPASKAYMAANAFRARAADGKQPALIAGGSRGGRERREMPSRREMSSTLKPEPTRNAFERFPISSYRKVTGH